MSLKHCMAHPECIRDAFPAFFRECLASADHLPQGVVQSVRRNQAALAGDGHDVRRLLLSPQLANSLLVTRDASNDILKEIRLAFTLLGPEKMPLIPGCAESILGEE